MAIFHCTIKIIKRSSGKSAVASAAYIAGERIVDEETGRISDYRRKFEVEYKNIIIPDNVPEKYRDRSFLWNEVQRIENKSDAQLCRSLEIALPLGLNWDDAINLTEDYIKDNFTSKGMIADYAIHAKPGNPHVHILLTMRGFDEEGNWVAKSKTAPVILEKESETKLFIPKSFEDRSSDYLLALQSFYMGMDVDINISLEHDSVLDKEVIKLKLNQEYDFDIKVPEIDPATNSQKIIERPGKGIEHRWYRITTPANDWNDRGNAEIWRKSWADHCNNYLPPELHIDHRSYERQGIDLEPMIHEGYVARDMEAKGNISNRCQTNREIRQRNSIRKMIKSYSIGVVNKLKELLNHAKSDYKTDKGNPEHAGSNNSTYGRSGKRNRLSSRPAGRDNRNNQTVDKRKHTSEETTFRDETLNQIKMKESELYGRIQKLLIHTRIHSELTGAATGGDSELEK